MDDLVIERGIGMNRNRSNPIGNEQGTGRGVRTGIRTKIPAGERESKLFLERLQD